MGDLQVAVSLGQEAQDLDLAVGQGTIRRGARLEASDRFEHFARDGRMEGRSAAVDVVDGPNLHDLILTAVGGVASEPALKTGARSAWDATGGVPGS
jgi:hypothetical protein